ncbi:MAG: metallophosphatase family protein [Chloroflexota bacterium]|nr:metallophosphatase family protein [Chloroflexota bacterium]
MKIALLSDIHGNALALDAVLADIQQRGGVDSYWILGDLVALGPDPVGVLERLNMLPDVSYVRGNTDRYVVSPDRPPPTLADVRANPSLLPILVEVAGSFAWTQGAITIAGWLPWLKDLPLERTIILPDGTQVLGVHAAPGRDDGDGITPEMSDTTIQVMLQGCMANVVCVGHTHRPMNRQIGRWHVINLGSVSNPPPTDWRASYVLLEASETGYDLEHYRVDYDRAAVIRALDAVGHPGAAFIRKQLGG